MKPGDDFAIDALAGFLPLAARDRLGRDAEPGGNRNAHASRQDRHGPELAAGAGIRSRLSRGLGARLYGCAARLAGVGNDRAALHRPSSVGRGRAREKSRAWHARGGRRGLARRRSPEIDRPACAGDGASAPRAVVQPASLARARRAVQQSVDSQCAASRHSRRRSAARAQKRIGDHARRSRPAARDLRAGQGGRSARPRALVARLRLRRASPLGNRAAQSRRSRRARAGRRRP